MSTFGACHKGWVERSGSGSGTSSAALMRPLPRASRSAAGSTVAPRPAPTFMPGDADGLHPHRGQPLGDRPSDRPVTEDQRGLAFQVIEHPSFGGAPVPTRKSLVIDEFWKPTPHHEDRCDHPLRDGPVMSADGATAVHPR